MLSTTNIQRLKDRLKDPVGCLKSNSSEFGQFDKHLKENEHKPNENSNLRMLHIARKCIKFNV